MEILKRIKSSTFVKTTVAYEVSIDGKVCTLTIKEVMKFYKLGMISNAVLVSDGEFRAKSGYHIDTVINTKSLSMGVRF